MGQNDKNKGILDFDMSEDNKPSRSNILDFGEPEKENSIIKVIGVGGGGGNAVNHMYREGIHDVSFVLCNTDNQALNDSPVPVHLQLGKEGLGAGNNPETGRKEAENSIDSIEQLFDDNCKMVFVTATMGGGTGTGAAPVVARVAKEKGLLTIGVVTIPFYFEHRKKIVQALKGVEQLRKHVDALLVINNERLCDIYSNTSMTLREGFSIADDVLRNAVKGIAELITISSEGDINLDFRDVETTMRSGGGAIMAIGRAGGEQRVYRAIIDALESPLLLGNDIGKARRILFNIYTSEEMPIRIPELQEISDFFDELNPEIDVIWGTQTDNSLGEDAKVIILASDIPDDVLRDDKNDIYYSSEEEYYERLITLLYKPMKIGNGSAKTDDTNKEFKDKEPEFRINNVRVADTEDDNGGDIEEETDAQPATISEKQPDGNGQTVQEPIVNRWKKWLNKQLNTIMSDVSDND